MSEWGPVQKGHRVAGPSGLTGSYYHYTRWQESKVVEGLCRIVGAKHDVTEDILAIIELRGAR